MNFFDQYSAPAISGNLANYTFRASPCLHSIVSILVSLIWHMYAIRHISTCSEPKRGLNDQIAATTLG